MMEQYEDDPQLELMRKQASQNDVSLDAQASALREETVNLVREQLSLEDELEMIENLLRGRVQVKDEFGIKQWKDPVNEHMEVLTEYGVHVIMNAIQFYLNKNTLLSNYETEVIDKKMEDFATTLADDLFMEYELVFRFPSDEDCYKVLMDRLERKKSAKIYNAKLYNKEVNEEEIWDKLIHEIDPDKERKNIREQLMKNKLKKFELLMRCVQDSIHSTYLRAWNGQERRTLRQHIHISETTGNKPMGMQKAKPSNWFKR